MFINISFIYITEDKLFSLRPVHSREKKIKSELRVGVYDKIFLKNQDQIDSVLCISLLIIDWKRFDTKW